MNHLYLVLLVRLIITSQAASSYQVQVVQNQHISYGQIARKSNQYSTFTKISHPTIQLKQEGLEGSWQLWH